MSQTSSIVSAQETKEAKASPLSSANTSVLILGAGVLQEKIIQEVNRRGWTSIAADQNSNAAAKDLATHFIPLSTANPDAVIAELCQGRLAQDLRFCVNVGTDMSMSAALINERFGLEGLNVEQAKVTTDKGLMRKFLTKHNFPQPASKVVSTKESAYRWAEERLKNNRGSDETAFVIKPTNNMGARGVIYIPKLEDISFAFELAIRESLGPPAEKKTAEVIIEEFIGGDEISVDALVFEGRCRLTGVADRIIERENEMYFIEKGHNLPTLQTPDTIQKIEQTMQRLADCLGQLAKKPYHGALKGDLILTPEKEVYIGEAASRLSGGFMSTHTFEVSSGQSLMKAYLDLLNKEETEWKSFIESLSFKHIAIERSVSASAGRLEKLELPQKLSETGAVLKYAITNYQEGELVHAVKSNVGKLAHVVIQGSSLLPAEKLWHSFLKKSAYKTNMTVLPADIFRKQAKKNFNPAYCWVCRECDGFNCASSVPGMGGLGKMQTFQTNIDELRKINLRPRYLLKKGANEKETDKASEPNLKTKILGISTDAPILTAPITGSITNMGGSISEWDYAYESAYAAKRLGLIPTFGDGSSPDKYWTGLRVIEKLGSGFPVFKPRTDVAELEMRIEKAEKIGALAWGMDIDAIWFKTMRLRNQNTNRKTLEELKYLKEVSSLPFFLKGVMSLEDAELACEAGASAIIVSNHGGRVLDSMPATARVLPEIAEFMKKNYPDVEIWVDGGIRSGNDIFKMLGLGAQAVLIGRPLVIATVGLQRIGAYHLLKSYIDELKNSLEVMGHSCFTQISKEDLLV